VYSSSCSAFRNSESLAGWVCRHHKAGREILRIIDIVGLACVCVSIVSSQIAPWITASSAGVFYFEMFRWYRSIQAVRRKSRNNNGNNSSVYLELFNDTDCFGMISSQESRGSIGWALTALVALIHGKLRAVPLM
jgi:hypothetical protein